MSINVETIGGGLMVQHYVEDISKKDHCRVLSTSDVLTPSGWTKIKVIWELSVKAIDKDSCELTNRVMGSSTPEFLHYSAKSGIPFESAKQSLDVSAPAHNAQRHPSSPRVSKRRRLRRRQPLASRSARHAMSDYETLLVRVLDGFNHLLPG